MRAIFFDIILSKAILVKTISPVWPGICWTPFSSTTVADLPEPTLPGDRWVRVRNHQCGLCATDLSLLLVYADPVIAQAALPGNKRFYLGHEVVSTVVTVGPGVTRFKPGDRVVMDTRVLGQTCLSQEIQPWCRYCAVGEFGLCLNASANRGPRGVGGGWGDGYTAHESEVFPVPDDITNDQAMLMEPMAVGLHAVLRRPPQDKDHILILGCGVVGLFTLQAARAVAPGCHITALARYPHQAEAARRFGANEVVSHSSYAEMARITNARYYTAPMNKGMLLGGFDKVFDCVGTASTLEDSLRWAVGGGAVVIVGIDFHRIKLDLSPIWYQEVDLVGSLVHGVDAWQGQRRHTYDWVIDLLRAGSLSDEGIVTHRFRFEQYRKAVTTCLDKKRARPIKVAFSYD